MLCSTMARQTAAGATSIIADILASSTKSSGSGLASVRRSARYRARPRDAPGQVRGQCPGLAIGRTQEAVLPPLTLMIWPVINDALGEATNTMASAISVGVPTRLS